MRIGAFSLGFSLVAAVALRGAYQRYVVDTPGPDFDREQIRRIIAQESPVYYRDGTTRVGVFFEDEHRTTLGWPELPPAYVVAIVAAEDANFWSHRGVDPAGLARAIWLDVRAGALVAGGSTLTQQTSKNLFYRPDRSMRSKAIELLNALRLEAHFSKEEILTFYANQFHVTGNGRGLGIAARYFFDKQVHELTLVETAFLAGLVKGPSNYDPFVGDAERQQAARERANDRARYVLRRMVDTPEAKLVGPLPVDAVRGIRAEAAALLEREIELPFRQGTFRFESNAVLDEVGRRLSAPPFDAVLAAAGIDDPATAGIEVVTTLDADVQREATYALWHHLTVLGTMLESRPVEAFRHVGGRAPLYEPQRPLVAHEFRAAAVAGVVGGGASRGLALDLGGRSCTVDREGVERIATAAWRGKKKDPAARASAALIGAAIEAFPVGAAVWASVRSVDSAGNAWCDLELRPELQGSVVVRRDGAIQAMVAGNDNRNFNRATAPRQFGSTWKPVVFHAALELGWSPTDALDNRPSAFPFSTTVYAPGPDHEPVPTVSMAWAGVHSENVASVWLLYHLTDRLTHDETASLAASLGLARGPSERPEDYRLRIQRLGVLPTPGRIQEALFLRARQEVLLDLERLEPPASVEERVALASMVYGLGFDADPSLATTWLATQARMKTCEDSYRSMVEGVEARTAPSAEALVDWTVRVNDGVAVFACGRAPEGFRAPGDEWFEAGDPEEGGEPAQTATLPPDTEVLLDGVLRLGTLQAVSRAIERRRATMELVGEAPDGYDPEWLYWHQDFRVLLGMRYVADLASKYGVSSAIPSVLSLPLGAAELTLEEATSAYAGLISGVRYTWPGTGALGAWPSPAVSSLLIAEIRDVDGRVLYRATSHPERVASVETAAMTADILRNVVAYGTGKRAVDAASQFALFVPVGGKTGTTNDFKNVAFIGYVPVADASGHRADLGYTVGVYVGYDDNRPMATGALRVAGASGALPSWIGTVRGIVSAGLAGAPDSALRPLPPATAWPLRWPEGMTSVAVDPRSGLPSGVDVLAAEAVSGTSLPTVLVRAPLVEAVVSPPPP